MAIEIERKFLPKSKDLSFLTGVRPTPIVQGYLHDAGMTSRVRIAGDEAFFTLKGKAKGLARPEFEYPIPLVDARDMLENHVVGELVTKMRYCVTYAGNIWEVDVFTGRLEGLVIAEIELTSESQQFQVPPWAGIEVTGNKLFSNKSLALAKKRKVQALTREPLLVI